MLTASSGPRLTPFLPTDRSLALLRIHLSGYHVLPVLVLGPRSGPWFDLDGCASRLCLVHVPRCVVCWLGPLIFCVFSHLVREFCLRHPETRDVCDIGQMLFFNSRIAWYFTAIMFVLNNTFIQVRMARDIAIDSSQLIHSLGSSRADNRSLFEHDVWWALLG